jgi:hypothetical protein
MSAHDLAAMLRELADRGWRPLLYFEDGSGAREGTAGARPGWIAYPMAGFRAWRSCRADDPLTVVRELHRFALEHGGPPAPPAPPPTAEAETPAPAESYRKPTDDPRPVTPIEPVTWSACTRPRRRRTREALHALVLAAAAALRGGAPAGGGVR